MTQITRNGLTTTDNQDEARRFDTHEAAVEFSTTTPGVPITSRIMGFVNLIGGMQHHLIHLPGTTDRWVAKFIDPSQFAGPTITPEQRVIKSHLQTITRLQQQVADLIDELDATREPTNSDEEPDQLRT